MKVACITPTANRPGMVTRLIKLFLKQDYLEKELLIADSSEHLYISEEYPAHESVSVYRCEGSIGAKRNFLVGKSDAEIIIHFDDDDWYAPDYISKAVEKLDYADITGLSSAFFYRPHTDMWYYRWKGDQPYVIGSGMAYRRSAWERKRFPDKSVGEDLVFQSNNGRILPHDYLNGFMAIIHGDNTASHANLHTMGRVHLDVAKDVLGKDYCLF